MPRGDKILELLLVVGELEEIVLGGLQARCGSTCCTVRIYQFGRLICRTANLARIAVLVFGLASRTCSSHKSIRQRHLAVLAIGLFHFGAIHAHASEKPNIVVMMVDNLGWGELGIYGGGELRGAATPRLDKLAEEGMRLQNFNVEPQCTPTRSAFMGSSGLSVLEMRKE